MKLRFNKSVSTISGLHVLFLTGCVHFTSVNRAELENSGHMEDLAPGEPAVLATGTPEQIRAAAVADARADIATGHLRIAFTGGIAAWPVGVPERDFELVKPYPRVPLPTGCTSSCLQQAAIYAEAYNGGILPVLRQQKNL